ncbi:DUF2309 domain-containing protein [Ectobacillus polymachus]|uniref:DUF2309 domain-containing protein n=1 Tax=Ectobacillus polymachus TaxID=1508806 RepID=UPI003A894B54
MNTTLASLYHVDKEYDYLNLDIHDLVEAASKVIVPLGPIQEFAARSPWANLERQTFEQIARRLKDARDVDIYPSDFILQSARNRGEINLDFLKNRLYDWLDSQLIDLPREVAKRYCWAALTKEQPSSELPNVPERESLAKKLSRFVSQLPKQHSVQTLSQRLEQLDGSEKNLNHHMIKWCKLYLDDSQAVWGMPSREEGFYHAWRTLIQHDPALHHSVRKQLHDLPKEAGEALKEALLRLEIPYSEIEDYLEAHLLALPGWAGMMLWRSQQSKGEQSLPTEYLAVRISMEWALVYPSIHVSEETREDYERIEPLLASWIHWGDLPIHAWSQLSSTEQKARLILAYRFDTIVRNRLWLEAWEKTYEEHLMKMITSTNPIAENRKAALAQFSLCIDVRSEPFRRKLEQSGPFETFGTAGFFGLPIETSKLGCTHSHSSLPVMFKPQYKIKEFSTDSAFNPYKEREQAAHSAHDTFKTMKHNLLSSLVFPEVSGPWLSMKTIARSFVPRSAGYFFREFREKWLRKPSTELSLSRMQTSETELPVGFSEEEQVFYAQKALKMMGLTDHFATLVVICGHGSHSTNNPYAAALDCGACGGASSGFNARVLATLCNLSHVRQALETEGILIPQDTVFVAAEHITSLEELRWIYVPKLSDAAQEAFNCIQAVLPIVSEEANAERIAKLPNFSSSHNNPKAEASRLADDWSEVRPEWGLANNAAFIIGDRNLTKENNLGGRVFLHNYNWQKDKDGSILAGIIAGPATVTQWINLQYYASTVAPHYYGSGNKATQTVTSGIGVMQGNASDLLAGLPWQSVMQSDYEFYHSPLHLLVVIQAPKENVKRLLAQDATFHQKVKNGWIRLASIDPEGSWESWS